MSTPIDPKHRNKADPLFLRATGFNYLMRFFNGESISEIARTVHADRAKVRRLMKTAASTLIDSAQERIMAEIFPLMVKVIAAHLTQQLDAAKEGKLVDLGLTERLLKGMYVTEAPQLKTQLTRDVEDATGGPDTSVTTLEGFVARRVLNPPQPKANLPAAKIEVKEGTVTDGDEV